MHTNKTGAESNMHERKWWARLAMACLLPVFRLHPSCWRPTSLCRPLNNLFSSPRPSLHYSPCIVKCPAAAGLPFFQYQNFQLTRGTFAIFKLPSLPFFLSERARSMLMWKLFPCFTESGSHLRNIPTGPLSSCRDAFISGQHASQMPPNHLLSPNQTGLCHWEGIFVWRSF